MPYTTRVRGLLLGGDRRALTPELQVQLLEARVQVLKPYLLYMRVKALGDFPFLIDHPGGIGIETTLSLKSRREIVTQEKRDLKLQGLFRVVGSRPHPNELLRVGAAEEGSKVGRYLLVGITRDAHWVWIEVTYDVRARKRGGLTEIVPQQVSIESVEPEVLLRRPGVNFRILWDWLGEQVSEWVRDRTRRLQDAERVRMEICNQDYVLEGVVGYPWEK